MKPEDLNEMAIFIKRVLNDTLKTKEFEKVPVLYGGSVTKINGKDIVEKGNVNGLLVGRDSLKAEDFSVLIKEISS